MFKRRRTVQRWGASLVLLGLAGLIVIAASIEDGLLWRIIPSLSCVVTGGLWVAQPDRFVRRSTYE